MGWIWSASVLPTDATKISPVNPTTALPNPEQPSSNPELPETASTRPKRSATRDEIAEAELHSFLQELEADSRPSSTKYKRVLQPPPSHQLRRPSQPAPSNFTLEEELLPTQMSCRDAFDAAFYCQSLGGQFTNVYRYGGMRSCSENWKDFWFCMRIKSYSEEQKQGMIRDHYKKKSLKYKLGPSSEDVWESRERRLDWGEAFSEPVMWSGGDD